ncbi:MAG: drug/metabolite transporter (DMT)-like permease [Gammaproteobacteria bacterium]|jgi:drug/metabolite transporter (DMT)-like permease
MSVLSEKNSDKTLSLFLALSAGVWGLFWLPLRIIEDIGIAGSWSVAFFNACPLIVLLPLLFFNYKKLAGVLAPTLLAGLMIGMAFTLYSNGLVETTVARATMLYYLTPMWSTIIGVIWLSEPLTRARILAIGVAFVGLVLLLSNGESSEYALNIGDVYSFLSGIFWAIGVATLNRWPKIPILPLAAIIFLSTTIISAFFAGILHVEPLPELTLISEAFSTAAFWSIFIFLPSFCIIFRVSQLLFPGRVGILAMTEVVVAIVSATILIPQETMILMQWIGAIAIVLAGLIEVLFGYSKTDALAP